MSECSSSRNEKPPDPPHNDVLGETIVAVPPWYRSKRHLAPLACFLAVFIMYITRFALSQAILEVSKLYAWNEHQAAMVTYSFYVGYLSTQVLGGYFSHRLGSKPVVTVGLLISCLMTCLFPLVADKLYLVVILRVLTGVGQGVLYPAMTGIITQWVLPSERSFVFNFAWSGGQAGTIFALGSFPYFAFWTGSWKWPFYIYAFFGFIWYLFWHFFIYSSPEEHPNLDIRERSLLQASKVPISSVINADKDPVPWLLLLKSPSIYVIMSIYFSYCWAFYLLISYLPNYLTYVLGFKEASQGLLAMTPYIGLWLAILASGYLSDILSSNGMSLLSVRKLMVSLGLFPSACLLLILSFFQYSEFYLYNMVSLFLIITISGISMAGYSPNPMDLSPAYAGIILSLGNVVGGSAGIFSLLFTGAMLDWGECGKNFPPSESCLIAWSWLFRVSAGMYLLGNLIWHIFARVKPLNLTAQNSASLAF